MTDTITLYPKTLCDIDCKNTYKISDTNRKTNLAVNTCNPNDFFNCYSKIELKKDIQPQDKYGIYDLNPQLYQNNLAPGFDKIGCRTECPNETYISNDPRLLDVLRAQYLPLDRPPMTGNVKLKDVYDKKIDNYKTGYLKNYSDINDGQITYYIDKSIENAFYKPVYSEPSIETTNLLQDPMGSIKTEHNRTAIVNTQNPATTSYQCYPYNLSFIQDSASYREDLIALQQRKNNQQKWSARWT
jgi:hypothetical protein